MSMAKRSSHPFVVYLVYLSAAGLLAANLFLADDFFHPMLLFTLGCVSLTFFATYLLKDSGPGGTDPNAANLR